MPDTPRRTVRVPEHIWVAAKEAADENGVSMSEVIRTCLTRWVREHSKSS